MQKSFVCDLMNILRQILQASVDIIYKNSMNSPKIFNPATRVEKRTALTDKEGVDLIAHRPDLQNSHDRRFKAFWMVTGMRPGEIYGLRWEDVCAEEGVIHIRRVVAFCKNEAIVGDTKTKAGVRSIPLSPHLLKFLAPCEAEGFIINRDGEPYTEQMRMATNQAHHRHTRHDPICVSDRSKSRGCRSKNYSSHCGARR